MNTRTNQANIVIFDLDGTLADITARRALAAKPSTGKMHWGVFFDPKNISLDQPKPTVIEMAKLLHAQGYHIHILSGRSDATYQATVDWLHQHHVPFDALMMRPKEHMSMKDSKLKQMWLDGIGTDNVAMVFDDRTQVVDMWRNNGLTCFQVADGDF